MLKYCKVGVRWLWRKPTGVSHPRTPHSLFTHRVWRFILFAVGYEHVSLVRSHINVTILTWQTHRFSLPCRTALLPCRVAYPYTTHAHHTHYTLHTRNFVVFALSRVVETSSQHFFTFLLVDKYWDVILSLTVLKTSLFSSTDRENIESNKLSQTEFVGSVTNVRDRVITGVRYQLLDSALIQPAQLKV